MTELVEGTKHDSSKLRFDLLSAAALSQLSAVLTEGARKYEAHNWRKGIAMSRLLGASYRHLNAILSGEDVDPEFGLLHAAHLMCCAMFMVEQTLMRPEFDDRWKPPTKTIVGDKVEVTVEEHIHYIKTGELPDRKGDELREKFMRKWE